MPTKTAQNGTPSGILNDRGTEEEKPGETCTPDYLKVLVIVKRVLGGGMGANYYKSTADELEGRYGKLHTSALL